MLLYSFEGEVGVIIKFFGLLGVNLRAFEGAETFCDNSMREVEQMYVAVLLLY